MTAHNERRQPAELARSCGCLPHRGKHCSLPGFATLNRGPTLTTPHLRGGQRAGRPTFVGEGFIPPGKFTAAANLPGRRGRRPLRLHRNHSGQLVGAGHARPAGLPLRPRYRFTCRGGCSHPPAGLRRLPLYWWICREGACPLCGGQRAGRPTFVGEGFIPPGSSGTPTPTSAPGNRALQILKIIGLFGLFGAAQQNRGPGAPTGAGAVGGGLGSGQP